MRLKTVTLVTAIVNAVALVASVFSFVSYARRLLGGAFGVHFLSSVSPWAPSLIADAMLVIFLFVLYARQQRQ